MKHLAGFCLAILLLAALPVAAAPDSVVNLQSFASTGKTAREVVTTLGTGEVIPHVILDNGLGGGGLPTTTVMGAAFEASHVLKSSAGSLVSLHVYSSAAQYLLIIDAGSLPADGAVTLLYPPIKIAADSNVSVVFEVPISAANGIVVCNSSTGSFT